MTSTAEENAITVTAYYDENGILVTDTTDDTAINNAGLGDTLLNAVNWSMAGISAAIDDAINQLGHSNFGTQLATTVPLSTLTFTVDYLIALEQERQLYGDAGLQDEIAAFARVATSTVFGMGVGTASAFYVTPVGGAIIGATSASWFDINYGDDISALVNDIYALLEDGNNRLSIQDDSGNNYDITLSEQNGMSYIDGVIVTTSDGEVLTTAEVNTLLESIFPSDSGNMSAPVLQQSVAVDVNTINGDTTHYTLAPSDGLEQIASNNNLTLEELFIINTREDFDDRFITDENGADLFLYEENSQLLITTPDNDFGYIPASGYTYYVFDNEGNIIQDSATYSYDSGTANNVYLDFSTDLDSSVLDDIDFTIDLPWEQGTAFGNGTYSALMDPNVLNSDNENYKTNFYRLVA